MIEVDSFVLRNVVHFNEAKVPVKKNCGLVIISGLNKDSRIAEDQNNGAGKSLLWSAIPNCRYAAAPSSTLKNTKKDMLDSSKSEIEIRFRNNHGQKVRFIQKPTKWLIEEQDPETGEMVDSKARTTAIQQEKMAEHFPLTQDEFYAYTYLSSIQGQRLHFQVEKPAERLKFITSIFQLDSYDKLKKYFTNMLGRIKDEQTKFSVLESKLLNVNTQLDKVGWTEDDAKDAKKVKAEFAELQDERDLVAKKLSECERLLSSLKSLLKLVRKRDDLLESFNSDKPLEEIVDKLRKRKKVIREYEAYLKSMKSYERSTQRIRDNLEELEKHDLEPAKRLRKRRKALIKREEELRAQWEDERDTVVRHDRWTKVYDKAKAALQELGYDSPREVDTETDIDDEISICRTTLKLRKLLDSDQDSQCPTCMQSVDMKAITKNVKKAEKRLVKLQALEEARQVYRRCSDARTELKNIGDRPDIESIKEQLNEVRAERKSIDEKLHTHERIAELRENLSNIEKPTEPSKTPPKGASVDDIDDALAQCRELSNVEHSIDNMVSNDDDLAKALDDPESYTSKMKKRKKKHQDKLEKIDARYRKLVKKNSDYDLRLGEYRVLSKQKLELESDMEAIRPILEKRDLYKALEKAYSAKGLKVAKANEIVRLLEANLNRYSNLVFAEAFKFNVYAAEQGVFCEVDRGNGKITDVRLMSGAESDSFRLLFMLSLLLMIPAERRTNFVVLDEPDSHMDSRTRSLFAERFLPFLREVVPHVFLITPKDHHLYQECERWVVVKEGGVSILNRKGIAA